MDTAQAVTTLTGELKATHKELYGALGKQSEEIKRLGSTTALTAGQIASIGEKIDTKTAELDATISELKAKYEELELKSNRLGGTETASVVTMASKFLNSPEYKNYMAAGGTGKESGIVKIGSSYRSEFEAREAKRGNFASLERKDINGETVLRSQFATQRMQGIIYDPINPMRVRSLFTVIPTTMAAIEYVREDMFLSNAATVAEGALKPESGFVFVNETSPMRTIAHWVPVTRQLLADVPALETYMTVRLGEGLSLREDQQFLYGSGLGEDVQGIFTTDGIQQYAWSSGPSGKGDTKIDAIRRGLTMVARSFYPADGIITSLDDWQDIELEKASSGLYIWTNVATGNEPMLWRKPIIATPSCMPGDCLIGSFRLGAAIWDREEANLRITDSHSDFFIRNKLVLLVEQRVGMTVFRPKAFCKVDLTTAPSS